MIKTTRKQREALFRIFQRDFPNWVMQRCYYPKAISYKYYGGRGIKVCKRWHKFENFLADMGLRPAGRYSIERVDVNGDYKPSNCIWLPLREQGKNRRNSKRKPTY